MLLEGCVTSVREALRATGAGVHRIELCARIALGGLTPRSETVRRVRTEVRAPLRVMVRPRAGDYVYARRDRERMLDTIAWVRESGAEGIVCGALTPPGDVDRALLRDVVAAARPLAVTFHRAFDETRDRATALDTLIDLGVDAVLTSGGARTAVRGIGALAELVEEADGRIAVIAAGSIRARNVRRILEVTGVQAIHAHTDAAGFRALARAVSG